MAVSTALATSFKSELLNGMHNFALTVTPTATATSASASVTGVSSMTGVGVGMGVTGTNIAANTVVARITSSTAMTLSQATTGAISGGTITVSGDVFNIALIKNSPAGTFGSGTTNYSGLTTDETTGTGYVAGGSALTSNGAVLSGSTAIVDFADVSWTTATFNATGALIYNTLARNGFTTGRAVSVHSFGDTTVTSGTLTLIFPVADASNAIIRLS